MSVGEACKAFIFLPSLLSRPQMAAESIKRWSKIGRSRFPSSRRPPHRQLEPFWSTSECLSQWNRKLSVRMYNSRCGRFIMNDGLLPRTDRSAYGDRYYADYNHRNAFVEVQLCWLSFLRMRLSVEDADGWKHQDRGRRVL